MIHEQAPANGTDGARRAIIVNADDFGLTAGVNAGIIGAFLRGPVRGASLMVTTPGFADAVALARRHPALDLGVHLALTAVGPALPAARIPSLVARGGRFPPLPVWLARAAGGRLRADELRAELRAQLERALATGLPFSHLDGHHHTHLFAPVAAVAAELAREYGIPVVRRAAAPPRPPTLGGAEGTRNAERGMRNKGRQRTADPRPTVLAGAGGGGPRAALVRAADRRWGGAYDGLGRAAAFTGFRFPATVEAWRGLLRALPPGVTEMMCHPGLVDDALRGLDAYVAAREAELRGLGDPRVNAIFGGEGVAVTSFAAARARGWLTAGAGGG